MSTVIEVNNLKKKFGTFVAVDGLSFSVTQNHVVGFLGPNGAGKTTTIRMLVGLSKPTSGAIKICGTEVVFGEMLTNDKIGYLPEQPSFYNWMSGLEYLGFIADTFKLTPSLKQQRIKELLALTGLASAKKRKIGGYSNGMKQRLGIAQALVNDPEVLIFDEPVSALDPIGRKEVMQIIEQLKHTKTILISTHILADVDRICDDIIMLDHGRKLAESSLMDLKEKYAAPILEVEFASDPSQLLSKLKDCSWVERVEQNGVLLKIWVADRKAVDANEPLKLFAKQDLGVLSYGLKLPNTEDLFVQLLKENSDGSKSH